MDVKKLYRVPEKGMIGGVCAGLGEYLNADPTVVRLIFILLALTGFSGVIIYIIMWLVVPVEHFDGRESSESEPEDMG